VFDLFILSILLRVTRYVVGKVLVVYWPYLFNDFSLNRLLSMHASVYLTNNDTRVFQLSYRIDLYYIVLFLHWRQYCSRISFSGLHRPLFTFRVSRRRREMYIGHAHLCVCVCVCLLSLDAFPHYCTDPDVTWGNGKGVHLLCTIERICNRCTGFVTMTT